MLKKIQERRRQENWHNDMRRRIEAMEARKNYYKERYYTLKKESEKKEKELQMKLKEKDELNQVTLTLHIENSMKHLEPTTISQQRAKE